MRIAVKNPTWFYAIPPFVIKDNSGGIFYISTNKADGFFTLPKGNYETESKVKIVENRKRNLPKLPTYERNIKRPKKFKLTLCNNTAKCSIKLESGEVFFDKTLWERLNKFQKSFILLHEFGHYFYKTEAKCDLFAKVKLLELGYNKSQVATVDFGILGDTLSSFDRKCTTFDAIINTK